MKSGAPPVLYGYLHSFASRINSMVSQREMISKGYHALVPGLISVFLETVWVPLKIYSHKMKKLTLSKKIFIYYYLED